ncbi:helix-turn-helix transcriptional regulator [Rhizobacter fulvus]
MEQLSAASNRPEPVDEVAQRRARKHRRSTEVVELQAVAITDPDALLSLHVVRALTGLSPTSVYDKVRAKTFPAPRRISSNCSRWVSREIRAWLIEQAAAA